MVDVGVDIYTLMSTSFLVSPLHVIADAYIWNTHIEAHVLLIGVPFAEHL